MLGEYVQDKERYFQYRDDLLDKAERASKGVLQPWVMDGPTVRMQAVLMGAIRGCDGTPKLDPSKTVLMALRADVLVPSERNWNPWNGKTFMGYKPDLEEKTALFLGSLDQYPLHFVTHLMHAAEIIGTYHPIAERNKWWHDFYCAIARAMHLYTESIGELIERLADF